MIVLPALAVSFIDTSGRPWMLLLSVLLAAALSVVTASVCAAIWARRPDSEDFVFADLMLWGWLRRVRAERRLAEAHRLIGTSVGSSACKVLQRLAAMLEAKDTDTVGHSRRVTRHAERIARNMHLSPEEVARVRIAASVHDIGKVHTPRDILAKPGSLTADEFEVMKRHPVDGARMTAEMGDPEISAMVRHHHERIDGSGYPDGLRGDEIPLGSRIISVADTFDAITSNRTYHGARAHRRALEIVAAEAGTRLDPDAVAAFLRYYSGKRAIALSALGFTGTPRVAGWLGGTLNGVGSPLTQSFAAIAAAALAGAALQGPSGPASAARERASAAGEGLSETGSAGRDDAGQRERGQVGFNPGARVQPVSDRPRPGERLQPNAPIDRSPGGAAPPGESAPGNGTPPLPDVETPIVEIPDVDVPDVDLPVVDVEDVELPDLTLPHVTPPNVELPQIRLPIELNPEGR